MKSEYESPILVMESTEFFSVYDSNGSGENVEMPFQPWN